MSNLNIINGESFVIIKLTPIFDLKPANNARNEEKNENLWNTMKHQIDLSSQRKQEILSQLYQETMAL